MVALDLAVCALRILVPGVAKRFQPTLVLIADALRLRVRVIHDGWGDKGNDFPVTDPLVGIAEEPADQRKIAEQGELTNVFKIFLADDAADHHLSLIHI